MFERPKNGERALLVHVELASEREAHELDEFCELVASAGAETMGLIEARRRTADPRLLVGLGKAQEIKAAIDATGAEVVIVDHTLSPSQERNLEREFDCRVVDRTGLILDIFAQRARSFEGKLQVELAQLRHLSTRLVRGWTHLERQKGGIGLRGPGETQLESDRRLIGQRISQLKQRLAKVAAQRGQGRRARSRAEVPTVSLVGYTNAGKSTLFNKMTSSGVYAADQLFATLDPTLRRVELEGTGTAVVMADTVGFIRQLPHDLIAAFRSTLEETSSASLLLHVVDASSDRRTLCKQEVREVLHQIDAHEVPQIEVYNKTDLLDGVEPHIERDNEGQVRRVWLSARTGEGLELLEEALKEFFHRNRVRRALRLLPMDGRLRAALYESADVLFEQPTKEGGWEMEVEMDSSTYERLLKRTQIFEDRLLASSM
ncbi:MAG TPA: GTPase HflX [Chromatiales bacterium]|nr:GTPase HflX [Chromatiales bacterium]